MTAQRLANIRESFIRETLRFVFTKKLETLEAAAERLPRKPL